jgi:hypothetical protein
MPTKITALAQASIISETDLLYAVAGGNSRKIPAAALAGRNRIINGQGRVNQRAYASGAATSGANQYTLDRWRVVTSGQSLTFTGTDAGRTMTAPAGGCEQVIELSNIEGGTYIINWTGTATCTVDGTSRVKGETFTKGANTQCTVRMIGGTFTDVQVELGTTATPFERLPFGDELARCQRYFQKSYALSDAAGTTTDVGLCVSVCPTTVVRVQVPFLARMSGLPSEIGRAHV